MSVRERNSIYSEKMVKWWFTTNTVIFDCRRKMVQSDWIFWDSFQSDSRRRLTVGLSCRWMLQWWVIVTICSCCSSKALNSPMPLSLSDCTLHCHCPQCICVKPCGVSFVSCPAQAVDQSGVQGRRGYTTACGLLLHCTAYTEPEREGQEDTAC